jgi:lipid-A-disaccharide synthase
MLHSARLVRGKRPDVQFILPLASGIHPNSLKIHAKDCPITIIEGNTYDAMAASDLLLAASGTVTLEAGILGTPMVVTYKVSPVSFFLGRRFIKVSWASLVNLVAEKEIVPEILQDEATPERLSAELLSLINDNERLNRMKNDLKGLKYKLGGPGASTKAAELAASLF